MGNQAVVYGVIEGYHNYPGDKMYADWNESVLAGLPEIAEYPYLIKEMFAVSKSKNVSLGYCFQIIHFGASFKDIDDEWENWLVKFEALLSKLYCVRAKVHLEAELLGIHQYEWLAQNPAPSLDADGALTEPNYLWNFNGGSRPVRFYG